MASINGVSIKKLTYFKDHDGCKIAQGTIYYKGKALGEWSQDAWGGPDAYSFDEDILKKAVEAYAASDYVADKCKSFFDLDCFLGDLVQLTSDEKEYKKGLKDNYTSLVVCRGQGYRIKCNNEDDIRASESFKKLEEDAKRRGGYEKVRIYTSLSCFDIVVEADKRSDTASVAKKEGANTANRVTRTLVVKDVTSGDYFKGNLHDYITLEDEDGNCYTYAAIVENVTNGILGPIAEELERSVGEKFTLSFVSAPDALTPVRDDGTKKYWIHRPRILKASN